MKFLTTASSRFRQAVDALRGKTPLVSDAPPVPAIPPVPVPPPPVSPVLKPLTDDIYSHNLSGVEVENTVEIDEKNPGRLLSGYSVFCILFEDGRRFFSITSMPTATRYAAMSRETKYTVSISPIYAALRTQRVLSVTVIAAGLTRQDARVQVSLLIDKFRTDQNRWGDEYGFNKNSGGYRIQSQDEADSRIAYLEKKEKEAGETRALKEEIKRRQLEEVEARRRANEEKIRVKHRRKTHPFNVYCLVFKDERRFFVVSVQTAQNYLKGVSEDANNPKIKSALVNAIRSMGVPSVEAVSAWVTRKEAVNDLVRNIAGCRTNMREHGDKYGFNTNSGIPVNEVARIEKESRTPEQEEARRAEMRERRAQINRSPEARKKNAETQAAIWTPEKRAEHSARIKKAIAELPDEERKAWGERFLQGKAWYETPEGRKAHGEKVSATWQARTPEEKKETAEKTRKTREEQGIPNGFVKWRKNATPEELEKADQNRREALRRISEERREAAGEPSPPPCPILEGGPRVYSVFSFVFPDGRRYIAVTLRDPRERLFDHISTAKRNNTRQGIFQTIREHGEPTLEIHDIGLTRKEAWEKVREKIAFFRTNMRRYGDRYGFNLTDGSVPPPYNAREYLSRAMEKKWASRTAEQRNEMTQALRDKTAENRDASAVH